MWCGFIFWAVTEGWKSMGIILDRIVLKATHLLFKPNRELANYLTQDDNSLNWFAIIQRNSGIANSAEYLDWGIWPTSKGRSKSNVGHYREESGIFEEEKSSHVETKSSSLQEKSIHRIASFGTNKQLSRHFYVSSQVGFQIVNELIRSIV